MICTSDICNQGRKIVQELKAEIKRVWQNHPGTKNGAEVSFLLCSNYWRKLKELAAGSTFPHAGAEMNFFKEIKTGVTSEFEYYSLLCQSELFKPENPAEEYDYWRMESERLERFTSRFPPYYEYYVSGRTDRDMLYFTRKGKEAAHFPEPRLYQDEPGLSTGYDYLYASFIAHERYHVYVMQMIEKMKPAANPQA